MTSFMTSAMTTALCWDEQQVSSCICCSLLVYSLLIAAISNYVLYVQTGAVLSRPGLRHRPTRPWPRAPRF